MTKKKNFHPGGNVPTRRPRKTFRGGPIPTLGGQRRRRRRLPTRMPAGNPMMPTSGMDRMGRPVQGTVAMPGPAPDAARMRRMQNLMRRQRQSFNQNRRTARTQSPAERLQAGSFNFNPNSQRQQKARRRMKQGFRNLMQ